MNPAKLLDDVLLLVRKYSPILVVHAVLLFWIGSRVLSPTSLPHGATLWPFLTAKTNGALKAVGLSLQLWYVLAALVIAYLAAFEGARSMLSGLPILQISYVVRYKPRFLGYAAKTLRARPDAQQINERVNELVDQYSRELREKNQPNPYQWHVDRQSRYNSYYGTLLVVCLASFAWAISGGAFARSPDTVWRLTLLVALAAAVVRWRAMQIIAAGRMQLAGWALREFKRRETDKREDPLAHQRAEWTEKQARFTAAMYRSPALILLARTSHLPESLKLKLYANLKPPAWGRFQENWDIIASWKTRHRDEEYAPPASLKLDGLEDRFSSLLECTGAGLCILVPSLTGLAPAVEGAGSGYSFAQRRHTHGYDGIRLKCRNDFTQCEFDVRHFHPGKAFLAEVGEYPIERLAQRDFPPGPSNWYALTRADFDEGSWISESDLNGKVIEGVPVSWQLPVHPGSTYLMRAKLADAEYVTAFQCFKLGDTAKILLVWRILDVFLLDGFLSGVDSEVHPWWEWRAWRGLWKANAHRTHA